MNLLKNHFMIAIVGLHFAAISPAVAAPEGKQTITAASYSLDSFELTAGKPSVSRSIVVDQTPLLSVSLLAASRTLSVSLTSPKGKVYKVGGKATTDFESSFFPIEATTTTPGASYLLSIKNPARGKWILKVEEPATIKGELDVIVTNFLNNSTRLVVAGGGGDYPVDGKVRVAVVAFDGTRKITGLSIGARLLRPQDPTFTPVALDFRDDGKGADEKAKDGIYEAFASPTQPGDYQVQVQASGTSSTGKFVRTGSAQWRSVPHIAHITGFSDRGIDADSDGLYESIGITPSATLDKEGTYSVSVRLRASNGREVQRSLTQDFAVGTASVEITFSAAELLEGIQINGPYDIVEVRYFEIVSGEPFTADIRYDLGKTAAYPIDQLQHPKLRLSGAGRAFGVDGNKNGLFDQLEVELGIISDVAGNFNYSTTLVNKDGSELGFVSGTISLVEGNNSMPLTFPGLPIGQGGIDGPYYVSNLLLFGAGESLVASRAFTTQRLTASQFEGYVGGMPGLVIKSSTAVKLNKQTGLFTQELTIRNSGTTAVPGFRVMIRNLTTGFVVYNGSGSTSGGIPYLSYSKSLVAGESVTVKIEYYSKTNRNTPTSKISVELIPSVGKALNAAYVVQPVEPPFAILSLRRSEVDGSVTIEFASEAGAEYHLQYSDDLLNWQTVLPAIHATGDRVEWTDSGPPATEKHPSAKAARFYRVLKISSK